MLQVYIEHHNNQTIAIQEICDGDKILAELEENNSINLDVCIPYINQRIEVHHVYTDDNSKNCTLNAILEAVETEPMTKAKCIRYSMI